MANLCVFSRLLPFLHCSLYLLPSIFASFSQVRFFFGTKAFLWPIVCVLVEFVAFANLFVYSHMVRTQTNAHCYRNAGHHSYRMKEWELQLKVHNGIHNMKKKTEQPTTTTLTTSAGRAEKKVAAKNRNKLPYAVAVVLKSRHEHRMNSDTLLFQTNFPKTTAKLGSDTCGHTQKMGFWFLAQFYFQQLFIFLTPSEPVFFLISFCNTTIHRWLYSLLRWITESIRWENLIFIKH